MENYESRQNLNNPMGDGNFMQSSLPNATAVLILGIVSIIGCCFYGIGLIAGIIGLVLASKDMKLYRANPNAYSNYSTLNIGRILCIIGIVLFLLAIISALIVGSMFGWDALTDQELMNQRIQEWAEQNQ